MKNKLIEGVLCYGMCFVMAGIIVIAIIGK